MAVVVTNIARPDPETVEAFQAERHGVASIHEAQEDTDFSGQGSARSIPAHMSPALQ